MIKTIAVIGAGTMGHSIANSFAMHGYPVSVFMRNLTKKEAAQKAMKEELDFLAEEDVIGKGETEAILGRVTFSDDLAKAVADADYIIESVAEDLAVKQDLFEKLEKTAKKDAVVASNTSSLAFDRMTEKMSADLKARTMVCHWYNPGHIMPIVELSYFGNMSEARYKDVEQLYLKIEKRPVKVLKDVPGLVANRIQQAVAREVFSLMQTEVAAPEDIDRALKFGPAFRYATTGQLEVADFGGLDIWCAVGDNLLAKMDNSQAANPILRAKVEEGKLGFKSGEGFFRYPEADKAKMRNAFNKRLIHQLKASKAYV